MKCTTNFSGEMLDPRPILAGVKRPLEARPEAAVGKTFLYTPCGKGVYGVGPQRPESCCPAKACKAANKGLKNMQTNLGP
jgi:hypothetical protein